MSTEIKEEKEAEKTEKKAFSVPFPVLSVRSIAKQSVSTNDSKKGITIKAGHILSIAAGKILQDVAKEAAEIAKNTDQHIITKAVLIEICLKHPKYRFMIPLIKQSEMQQYFGPATELSRRLATNMTNRAQPLAIPFVAPNPPGRSTNSEEDALIREAENADAIFHALTRSISAYQVKVPSFLIPKRLDN